MQMDTSKVTRFEVIDHTGDFGGRVLVRYGVSVRLLIQDDDRTLKVVITDSAVNEETVREDIARGLAEALSNTGACGVCTVFLDGSVQIRNECPVHGLRVV